MSDKGDEWGTVDEAELKRAQELLAKHFARHPRLRLVSLDPSDDSYRSSPHAYVFHDDDE